MTAPTFSNNVIISTEDVTEWFSATNDLISFMESLRLYLDDFEGEIGLPLSNLNTTSTVSVISAINELAARIDPSDIIGSLSSLTTTEKTNVVSAINEVDAILDLINDQLGTLSSLNTTEKSNLVGAINEVLAAVGAITGSTDISITQTISNVKVASSTGTDGTIPASTPTLAGVLSGSDKTKLDGIETSADVNPTDGEIVTSIDTELGHSDWKTGGGVHDHDDLYVPKIGGEFSGNVVFEDGDTWALTFRRSGYTDISAYIDNSNNLSFNGALYDYSSGAKYWNSNNDGTGSGLDADLLDGVQGADYWNSNNDGTGSGLDADLLDGVEGSDYARTDINETFGGAVTIENGLYLRSAVNDDTSARITTDNSRAYFQVYDTTTPTTGKTIVFSAYGGADVGNFQVKYNSAYHNIWHSGNIASQAQAEAGAENTLGMTSLRTKQAIDAQSSGGAWELISSATASGSSSVDFTDLNSNYIMYKVVGTGIVPSSNGIYFYLRTSTNNGSTYDSSGYKSQFYGINQTGAMDVSGSALTTGIIIGSITSDYWWGTGTNESGDINIDIFNPSATTYTRVLGSVILNGSSSAALGSYQIGGIRISAADVDAIRFRFASGNIATGTFKLYGLKAN